MAEKHDLSEAGRARCAESGASNLARWKENRSDARAEIEADVAKFRAELIAELGGEAKLSAAQAAGVVSACALYTSILQTQRALLVDLPRRARMAALHASLPVLSGSFLRVLRSLGINLSGAGGGANAPSALERWEADYAERQRAKSAKSVDGEKAKP